MAITIRDILTLECGMQFVLAAGKSGLDNVVTSIDILDFGWENDKSFTLDLFDKNSFVVSSLQLAKGDSQKLYTTLSRMIDCGVVGLAYKPVFFKDLPSEILEMAEKNKFAIFRIENSYLPYGEIICEITDAIHLNDNILQIESCISRMLSDDLKKDEIPRLTRYISTYLQKYAQIVVIHFFEETPTSKINSIIRHYRMDTQYKNHIVLCRYDSELIIIITADSYGEKQFNVITDIILDTCRIPKNSVSIFRSNIHPTFMELDQCIKEAFCAFTAGYILDKQDVHYRDIGILSFLIPMVKGNSPHVYDYMHNFLSPILDNEEYMATVVALTRAEGDMEAAACKLKYHKNTLRYRVNKIHTLLSPGLLYQAFYENLVVAVKIYLIYKYLHE